MKKIIYTLVGPAANGKSKYSTDLMNKYSGFVTKVINADTIRKRLYGDPKIQGNGREVFEEVYKDLEVVLRDDKTVLIVIDNTSLTYKIRKRYYEMAHALCPMFGHEYEYNLVFFNVPIEQALIWNQQRDRHVPDDVIAAQYERYQKANAVELAYCNIIEVSYGN